MNAEEFYAFVVRWIRSRWSSAAAWADERAGVIAGDFEKVPLEIAQEALRDLYDEGAQMAPSPSKVMGACRRVAARRGIPLEGARDDPCWNGDHLWSIIGESNKVRELMCARCKVEETRPAHLAPTDSEVKDRKYSGRGDKETDHIGGVYG